MQYPIQQIIKFYRDAYQHEYSTNSIYNFFSNKVSHQYFPTSFQLLSQADYIMPVDSNWGEETSVELELSSSEKKLVAGSFFVKGKTTLLGTSKKIFSPLFLHDVSLGVINETYTLQLLPDSISVNPVAINYLNNLHPSILYQYEELAEKLLAFKTPFAFDGLVGITSLLKVQYPLLDLDIVERRLETQAQLANLEAVYSSRKTSFENILLPDIAIGLVDKPAKSKGVIDELGVLSERKHKKRALLHQVFSENSQQHNRIDSKYSNEKSLVPVSLSKQQKQVLSSVKNYPLTLVVGPPGTGKSFTIAALAMDAIHQGKKVLITSKNEQACQVIHQKIANDIGIKGVALDASKPRFKISVAAKLRNIANGVGVRELDPEKYKKLKTEVSLLESRIEKLIQQITTRAQKELYWGEKLADTQSGFFANLQKKWISYKHYNSTPIWKLKHELHRADHKLRKKKKTLLKRDYQNSLFNLLAKSRSSLLKLEKAFNTNSGNETKSIFSKVDHGVILKALPVWICKSGDITDIMPLEKELFDLLIIDEASQCDIASSIPLLYRSKRAVVVGDPNQLRHISFLSKRKETATKEKYGISMLDLSYRDCSVLDQVNKSIDSQNAVIFLDEHYRSMPDIIDFSNKCFYDSQLKIMTAHPGTDDLNNLLFISLNGRRNEKGENEIEAQAILNNLQKLILDEIDLDKKSATSVGIISPFRVQVNLLKKLIRDNIELASIKKHRLLIETPFGFQGEERDKIFLSFTLDKDTHSAAYRYLNRPDVFNVGITRAKSSQEVYHSIDISKLPEDSLVVRYLSNKTETVTEIETDATYDQFTEEVIALVTSLNAGSIHTDRLISGARIDLIVVQQNRTVGIDLVGFPGDFEQQLSIENIERLERCGIETFILPFSSWHLNKTACQKAITKFLLPKGTESE